MNFICKHHDLAWGFTDFNRNCDLFQSLMLEKRQNNDKYKPFHSWNTTLLQLL